MNYNFRILTFIFFSLFIAQCKSGSEKTTIVEYKFHHELRQPSSPVSAVTSTLVLLHGYGSNEKDLLSIARYIDPSILVICPRAPITLSENKYSWYPMYRENEDWIYKKDEVLAAKDALLSYLDQLEHSMDISSGNLYVGGFSQGAIMSLTTGLLHPTELSGIVSLSGELYSEIIPMVSNNKALKDLNIFISHGLDDEVLLADQMQATAAMLEKKGAKVSAHWYPSKHTISQENYRDLILWIKSHMVVM